MKKKCFKISLFTLISVPILTFSQTKIPLISGNAKFSVEEGTIECDVTLSEFQHIEDYVIRLNSGLNILNIQSVTSEPFILGYSRSFADSLQKNESNSYFFPAHSGKGKFLPSKLRFQYVGKFPIIKDTLNLNFQKRDWRGNIAFNNHILRADGYQSAWLPILYDIRNKFAFTEVRYDIEIECLDCENLYINGNNPVKSNRHRFKSDIAREPYLFLGKYNVQQTKTLTLLNTNFSDTNLQKFNDVNNAIVTFMENYTQVPFRGHMVWVQGNTTTNNAGFAFVSYPTFTNVGYPPYDLESTFQDNYKGDFLQTIAHELGHYYFGTIKNYNNVLENIINEGFAEFISLKYLKKNGNQNAYANVVGDKLEAISDTNFEFKPIGKFKRLSEINDRETYAYDYQTLILLSIEKEIGEAKMQKWIQLLLKEDKPISDFDFLKHKLKQAIENDKKFGYILDTYLLGDKTVQSITNMFKE